MHNYSHIIPNIARLRSLLVIAVAFFCILAASSNGHAQTNKIVPEETIINALNLAKKIENENIVVSDPDPNRLEKIANLPVAGKLRQLRFLAMDAATERSDDDLSSTLAIYVNAATEHNSARDIAISKILSLQYEIQNAESGSQQALDAQKKLEEFLSYSDWFVAQRAALMLAILPTLQDKYDVALKDTQAALSMIPNQLSDDVLEAQYETFDQISFLQLSLKNIDKGILTTQQVVEKGLLQNRSIDGNGIINNMIYVFNAWHEYAAAEEMAEIMFKLSENFSPEQKSFTYFRLGQAQNNARHYDLGLRNLNLALANTDDAYLKVSIELARAISYAGLGNIEAAIESLSSHEKLSNSQGLDNADYEAKKIHARALIAKARGDEELAEKLMSERLKVIVQVQLSLQAKDIQSLQANLENDKNRVAEREAALMRETELKQSELDAKQRSNVFLMALAALLLLIAAAATGFAIWRQKISKILEIAAHDAEAGDRAKSQFLSVMSHELRTPLNGIIGIAGILSEKGETKELRNYNKLILKSGESLLELLSGILDMAQMESGKLSIVTAPTRIRQIIDGLYQAAKSDVDETKVQFTCFVSENVPDDLMLDSIRVKQSLSNLIANAVRFTEKGRIHIHTTMSEPDRKGVRDLTMIVADTGRGITDDVKEKLFKPFVQADSSLTRTHDGAGIGLAVTRGLSRLMGGDVTMTSTAGRGSEFKMVVKTCISREAEFDTETNRPVFKVVPSSAAKIDFSPAVSIEKLRADAAAKEKAQIKNDLYGAPQDPEPGPELENAPKEIEFSTQNDGEYETIGGVDTDVTGPDIATELSLQPASSENPRAGFSRSHPRSDTQEIEPDQLSGLNILVVEDIEANLEILCSLLEPVGCSVSCAENGQIAVDMMQSQTFDAVLMDIRMPVLDGIEATRAIRKLPEPQCSTAIIALTADASAENNAECLAAGADVFLTKPVIVSELFSSIRFARRKQLRQKQQALSA